MRTCLFSRSLWLGEDLPWSEPEEALTVLSSCTLMVRGKVMTGYSSFTKSPRDDQDYVATRNAICNPRRGDVSRTQYVACKKVCTMMLRG